MPVATELTADGASAVRVLRNARSWSSEYMGSSFSGGSRRGEMRTV
jgi:hypothetical protein